MNVLKVTNILKKIVYHLRNREYHLIYDGDSQKRTTADEIKAAMDDYPGVLTEPTEEQFLDYDIHFHTPDEIDIDFKLYYDGEKSDFVLRIEIHVDDFDNYSYAFYSVFVR